MQIYHNLRKNVISNIVQLQRTILIVFTNKFAGSYPMHVSPPCSPKIYDFRDVFYFLIIPRQCNNNSIIITKNIEMQSYLNKNHL